MPVGRLVILNYAYVWKYVHMVTYDPFKSSSQDQPWIHPDQEKDKYIVYIEGTCIKLNASVFVSVSVNYFSHASLQKYLHMHGISSSMLHGH